MATLSTELDQHSVGLNQPDWLFCGSSKSQIEIFLPDCELQKLLELFRVIISLHFSPLNRTQNLCFRGNQRIQGKTSARQNLQVLLIMTTFNMFFFSQLKLKCGNLGSSPPIKLIHKFASVNK